MSEPLRFCTQIMFKSYPMISRFVVFLFVPLLVLAIGSYIYLRRSLPAADGRSIKAGVSQPVAITRDEQGAVIINAKTDRDANSLTAQSSLSVIFFKTLGAFALCFVNVFPVLVLPNTLFTARFVEQYAARTLRRLRMLHLGHRQELWKKHGNQCAKLRSLKKGTIQKDW